jgi:hypothetical protein
LAEQIAGGDRIEAMITEGLLPAGDGASRMLFVGVDEALLQSGLPTASFILALERIR